MKVENYRQREREREREKGARVLYGLVKCDESWWQKTIWSNWTNSRKNNLIEIATKRQRQYYQNISSNGT